MFKPFAAVRALAKRAALIAAPRKIFIAALLPAAALFAPAATAQTFPHKPISLFTAGAGGGADFAARVVAQGVGAQLGQQVIVENRGGSPIIPAQAVVKAPADGHTLLFYSNAIWILPLLQKNVPYDPLKDFAPVAAAASSPNVLVVHPSLPTRNVKELIALAKARPGELNYAASPIGSAVHLAAELLNASAGVKVTLIPYKDAAGALNALISGEVQLMFPAAGSAMPLLKANRIRALAVTSARPSTLLPGVPTMAAAGLPGFDVEVLYAILAPAGTPPAIVAALNKAVVQAIQPPATRERFAGAGIEAVGGTPEQLAASIKNEMTTLGAVIRNAGIRLD